ncbi:MAG TPA: group III truncated hemoglobin [Holophagaceae bacterium]|nr:group III truncated hemoglobin [Holophagaceae bacterium]
MQPHADPGTLAHRFGHAAIAAVVDVFYTRIQTHETLAGPFSVVEDWPHHKAKITHFWWVVLGGDPYRGEEYAVPFKHFRAGFTAALLVDWLALFAEAQREILPRDRADEWHRLATGMGANLARMNAALAAQAVQQQA